MFTLEQMLTPVWDSDIVFGESFTMYQDERGEISAPFLFLPEKIIEVRSASLDVLYTEGKDYFLCDGKLFLPESTSIPYMEYGEIFLSEEVKGGSFAYPEGYLLFREGHFFHDRQIAVTYTCKKGGWQGYIPAYKGNLLKNTLRRLTEDRSLRVVAFGDSITVGGNASGLTGAKPFQPIHAELFAEKLKTAFRAKVELINRALGGQDSVWGMNTLSERVILEKPDLVVLAFGMNGGHKPEIFKSHISDMIGRIKNANPDADIILVATSTPNPILTDERAKFWNYQYLYGDVLADLEGDGIALVDMGKVQKEILKTKRYIDITGNNVNHLNDFFVRIHAQALTASLVK